MDEKNIAKYTFRIKLSMKKYMVYIQNQIMYEIKFQM